MRRRGRSGSTLARPVLGVVRLSVGTVALLAPGTYARTFGVAAEDRGPVVYMVRLFGIRTVFLGLHLLRSNERDHHVRDAIVIHACDTAAAVAGGVTGQLPARAAMTGTGLSALNTVMSVLAHRSCSRHPRRSGIVSGIPRMKRAGHRSRVGT